MFLHKVSVFTPDLYTALAFISPYVFSYQTLCLEIEQTQQASDSAELERWSKLSSSARDELATLKCILGSMKDNKVAVVRITLRLLCYYLGNQHCNWDIFIHSALQVRLVEVERWLEGVQEMMSRDTTALGGKEILQEELNQCKVGEP